MTAAFTLNPPSASPRPPWAETNAGIEPQAAAEEQPVTTTTITTISVSIQLQQSAPASAQASA
jgi:hypothetical protein